MLARLGRDGCLDSRTPPKPSRRVPGATEGAEQMEQAAQRKRAAERLALHELLRSCGCTVFDRPRPLAIGIHREIIALVGDEVSLVAIRDMLGRWTRSDAYLRRSPAARCGGISMDRRRASQRPSIGRRRPMSWPGAARRQQAVPRAMRRIVYDERARSRRQARHRGLPPTGPEYSARLRPRAVPERGGDRRNIHPCRWRRRPGVGVSTSPPVVAAVREKYPEAFSVAAERAAS